MYIYIHNVPSNSFLVIVTFLLLGTFWIILFLFVLKLPFISCRKTLCPAALQFGEQKPTYTFYSVQYFMNLDHILTSPHYSQATKSVGLFLVCSHRCFRCLLLHSLNPFGSHPGGHL